MIEWLPVARVDVEKVATALVTELVPSVVVPSKNVIVPVALLKDISAVNVTA